MICTGWRREPESVALGRVEEDVVKGWIFAGEKKYGEKGSIFREKKKKKVGVKKKEIGEDGGVNMGEKRVGE